MRTLEGLLRSFARATRAEHVASIRLAKAGRAGHWHVFDRACRSRSYLSVQATRIGNACHSAAFAPVNEWSLDVMSRLEAAE